MGGEHGRSRGSTTAAAVAWINATSTAQLAAVHPTSGGAYTFALYVVPGAGTDWTARWVAVAAVVVITGVNLLGITRTVQATVAILVPVVLILAQVIVAGILSPGPDAGPVTLGARAPGGPWGVLQAAGLLFFAFAGYARIATLGEEVRAPRRTIPRAVFGAALASLGSMLNLVAGLSRTGLAMAREGDLPPVLAAVSAQTSLPWAAQVAAGLAVIVLLLTADVLTVVGFSSFGVLVYYAVANLAAFTLTERVLRAPRWLNLCGAPLCLVLALMLAWVSVLVMLGVFAMGLVGRAMVVWRRGRR